MLLISQFKDAIQFLSLQYRSDVEELGIGHNKDYILTEEQFNILEEFTSSEIKKMDKTSYDSKRHLYSTKKFILNLRFRVGVTDAIRQVLYSGDEAKQNEALQTLNFYNLVKKVVIRSSSQEDDTAK